MSNPSSIADNSYLRAECEFGQRRKHLSLLSTKAASGKGWGFSKFLPKHTASFICHSNPIYFDQICLTQLTTQCVCFCRLYRGKSLILTLENRFILQCLLCLSLALTISPMFIPVVLEMGARVSSRLSMCSMMKVPPQTWNASPVPHVLVARLLNTCSFGWACALRL